MTRSITIQAEPVKGAVEEALSSARIYNERLEVRFGEQSYPLVTPSTTVELLINGVKTTERTILGPTDTIECSVLDEEKMTATAVVTVGKRMFRSLRKLIVGAEQLLDLYSEETTPESVLSAEEGVIEIGKANAGTVIQIGTKRHEFLHNHAHVTAKINEDGLLLIV